MENISDGNLDPQKEWTVFEMINIWVNIKDWVFFSPNFFKENSLTQKNNATWWVYNYV